MDTADFPADVAPAMTMTALFFTIFSDMEDMEDLDILCDGKNAKVFLDVAKSFEKPKIKADALELNNIAITICVHVNNNNALMVATRANG